MKLITGSLLGKAVAFIAPMVFVSCLEPAQAPVPLDPDDPANPVPSDSDDPTDSVPPDTADPTDSVPGPRRLSKFGTYAEIKVGDSLIFDGFRWWGHTEMGDHQIDSIVRTILIDSIFENVRTGRIFIYHTNRDTWRTYMSGYGTAGPGNPMIWRDSVFMGQHDTLFSKVDSFSTNNGDSIVFANYDFRNRADTSLYGITRYVSNAIRFGPNMPLFRFWNTTSRDSVISAGSDTLSGWSASDSVIGERIYPSFKPWYFIIEKSKGLKYFEYRHPMRYTGGDYWTWKRRDSH